jgi:hypothetical protein
MLFHSVELMREHSQPQFRFHGIVSDGGVAPDIVPQMASATIWIRHVIDETPVGSMNPVKSGFSWGGMTNLKLNLKTC